MKPFLPTFPVLKQPSDYRHYPHWPDTVPLSLLAPHEAQAQKNHSQSLQRLAERGGLSPCEMLAVLEDREWRRMDPDIAMREIMRLGGILK
jgi:hypothetical protein